MLRSFCILEPGYHSASDDARFCGVLIDATTCLKCGIRYGWRGDQSKWQAECLVSFGTHVPSLKSSKEDMLHIAVCLLDHARLVLLHACYRSRLRAM
jgi:hypothetical protein